MIQSDKVEFEEPAVLYIYIDIQVLKMGGLVRKRMRSDYDKIDDEVAFVKRPRKEEKLKKMMPEKMERRTEKLERRTEKLERRTRRTRRNSVESSDGESSSDSADAFRSAGGYQADAEISFKAAGAVNFAVPAKVKAEVKPVNSQVNTEEEDTREFNRRSPNGFLLPDPIPRGELLTDSMKQTWVLGRSIGVGGFGELYLAACRSQGKLSPEHFVIKIEPHSNGPLFVEVHFYIRVTKPSQLNQFKEDNSIQHLGVPRYIASGTHERAGQRYRFLVMERFGSDLQRILDHSQGGRLTDKTVGEVAIQVLDSLQYIHEQGYVHKDVKASNLLVGMGMEGQHKVHLVDYGLCSRHTVGGLHKQYTHDLRWAHEGTLEYTSRDAHIGCSSRRGDIEVLLYNLIEWWGGSLPWDRDLATPDQVKTAKFRAFANQQKFLRHCFRSKSGVYPALLGKMMRYVGALRFEQEPDYTYLRNLLKQEMKSTGCVQNGLLEFRVDLSGAQHNLPGDDVTENVEFLRPCPPDTRISAVFDKLCVTGRTWERAREGIWSVRDAHSLENPTQAMLDVQEMIRNKEKGNSGRKRTKSGNYSMESTELTPAMMEVMKLRKLRKLEVQDASPVEQHASLLPRSRTLLRMSPIPSAVVCLPSLDDARVRFAAVGAPRKDQSRVRSKELLRLDPFLPDPDSLFRRRTRSADVGDTVVSRNLRSAFRFGFGNMRTLIRQVSDSINNMF